MKLFWNSTKRKLLSWGIGLAVYLGALLLSIQVSNSESLISYPLEPYVSGSERVDLFFSLLTTIPFSWPLYFLRKDNFLEPVSVRMNPKKYLMIEFLSGLCLCFLLVFLVNIAGILFSLNIADLDPGIQGSSLNEYILGEMQAANPIKFGLLWSSYKGLIGSLICLLGLIFTFFVQNLFFALLAPFAIVFLENLLTALTGLSRYSITTTFVLNRLTPSAMSIGNITIGIMVLIVIIAVSTFVLSRYDLKNT